MPGVKSPSATPTIAQVCLGLSDPTRLSLLARLSREEVCVCDLQAHVDRNQPTVSRHLAMLRKCGLVTYRKSGRWCHYRRAHLSPALARIVDLAAPPYRRSKSSCC
jgi:ArsR family transcriptional regulator